MDAATGDVSWTLFRSGGPVSMPAVGRVGTRTVLVYVDQPDGEGAVELVAVDLADREQDLWRVELKATSRSGVTVAGARAFVGDEDGNVYAVGLGDGAVEWTARVSDGVIAPPTVLDDVYISTRDPGAQRPRLFALDADTGERRWVYSPPSAGGSASAVSVGAGMVFAGFSDRLVRAFSTQEGGVEWSSLAVSLFSPVAAPALATTSEGPAAVYAADVAGGLYRIDAETGERVWDHQLNGLTVRNSPVLVGSYVLLGLADGRLVALDDRTGDLVWQNVPSPGLIGAISVAPDVIVAVKGGARAGLVGFVHDDEETLVDVPSPTRVDGAALVGRYVVALAIVFLVIFVPARVFRDRRGPVAIVDDEVER